MKNVITAHKVMDALDVSVDHTSVMGIQWCNTAGFQVRFDTGTGTGTLSLEASFNYSLNVDGSVRDAGDWVTVPSLSVAIVSGEDPGGNSTVTLDALSVSAPFVRLHWDSTDAMAVGTISAWASAKSL